MSMNNNRLACIAEDMRADIFETLNNEINISGMQAGYVAMRVEREFLRAIQDIGDDIEGLDDPLDGLFLVDCLRS